jgi:acyl homoserine lactone synthase
MIMVIDGRLRLDFPQEIDAMHRIRKNNFLNKRGWQVPIINEWEIDGYDALCPLYLIYINQHNVVAGSVRLLPTTGLTMINDTFSSLLPDMKRIESPLIWESSRFSVDSDLDTSAGKRGLGRGTAELGLAMNEIGMRTGLTHIVTVYDALMHRVLRRAGCAGQPISEPQKIGDATTYAVFFEVSAQTDAALRSASEIEGSVLEQSVKLSRMDRAA